MRDKDDESRIKAYMEAKMKHIKRYNECMNLADGLDVEKFAELIRADEREACAKLCDKYAEANQESDIMCTAFDHCAKAIRARGDAIDISQERVDETAKDRHKWVGLTDEEIKEIIGPWGETPIKGYTRKLFDQIEAKLKEKNT